MGLTLKASKFRILYIFILLISIRQVLLPDVKVPFREKKKLDPDRLLEMP